MANLSNKRYISETKMKEDIYLKSIEGSQNKEAIKKEKARLKRQFSKIDTKRKNLVEATISDVAFLSVTMEKLRENIARDGTTIHYQNGANQYGEKQSPDAQLYLQMSQKLTAAMKILLDCLPKAERTAPEKGDGFEDFINGRGDG